LLGRLVFGYLYHVPRLQIHQFHHHPSLILKFRHHLLCRTAVGYQLLNLHRMRHGHQFTLVVKYRQPLLKIYNFHNIRVLHVGIGVTTGNDCFYHRIVILVACIVHCFSFKISF
uniref:Secreted protein n=1 Tax=Brugia timori TaxID=42155 RepID=A0A0R3RAS1_9BILA